MANIGFGYPIVAKYNGRSGYTDAVVLAKGTQGSATPTTYNVPFYGDDSVAETESGVSKWDIVLGLTELPIEAMPVLYGHEIDAETQEVVYKSNDVSNDVGTGFYVRKKVDGETVFDAYWYYKVKYTEPTDTFTTKGETVTFSGPSISGVASDTDDGYRIRKTFTSLENAIAWLNTQANYVVSA